MQRVTLHLGANKTGSSAIQAFLARNSSVLRAHGVVVPDEALETSGYVAGHHVWYFDQLAESPAKQGAEVAARRNHLKASFSIVPRFSALSTTCLTESESRSSPSRAAKQFPLEIVIYLRRQDDLLLSSWQQWFVKAYPDFWTWALSAVGRVGDWRTILERWESVVGRDRMHVRLYAPGRLRDDDAVIDFVQFLDVDAELDYRSEVHVNPSFDEAVVDLVQGGNFFVDGHDAGFYEFLDNLLGSAVYRRTGESSLTYEQRLAIIERYADGNAWVRDTFFADTDVPPALFELPQWNANRVPSRDELVRRQIQLLARCLYELERRSRPHGTTGYNSHS